MDPNQEKKVSDMTVEQAVAVLVRDMPKPVQDFITGPDRSRITLELSNKYGLHVDAAGTFERAFIFMLLGIATPEEFVQNLQEAGLSPATIQGLAADVNEKVFVRLRGEEERLGVAPAPAVAPPTPSLPATPPASQFTQTAASTQRPVVPAPPSSTEAEVRTMQSDMAMVKAGVHPTSLPAYSMPAATPVAAKPVTLPSVPIVQPAPRPAPRPPALPVPKPAPSQTQSPARPAPVQQSPQASAPANRFPANNLPRQNRMQPPKVPAPQSENREALHQILKEYGIDPYREPVE